MSIPYSDAVSLWTAREAFPVLAGMLRGAMAELSFEQNGEERSRTQLLSDVSRFPQVMMAVQGSDGRAEEREFFALPAESYRNSLWELANEADEETVRGWVRDNGVPDVERERAARAAQD